MADSFGLRLSIEGEKEFKNSLAEINQSFKVLGSEMQLVSSQFDKNDKSTNALTARNEVLNKSIDLQKDKIALLQTQLAKSAEAYGENDKKTQNYQIQLNKAQAELNGMDKELKQNEKALSGVGSELKDTGKETKDLGGAMDDTGKKSSVFGEMLKANLAAEAIKMGVTALIDLVKSLGAAVTEYVGSSMSVAADATQSQTMLAQVMRNTMDASDEEILSIQALTKAQEQMGVVSQTAQTTALAEMASFVQRKESLEEMLPVINDYTAYMYGATASSDQARNVATALGKAINGSIDGLAKQGFTLSANEKEWFKQNVEMQRNLEAQAELADGAKKLELEQQALAQEAQRVAFVTDMVSESMGGMNEALAQTDAGKMANVATIATNTQIAVGTMANDMKAKIMGEMLPAISELSGAFLGVLQGDGSIEELSAAIGGALEQAAATITTFLPTLIELGTKLITALITGIVDNMDMIIQAIGDVLDQLIGAIVDMLPMILDAGIKILLALANGISDALPRLIPDIVKILTTIVQILIDNLPLLLDAALRLIVGLAKGIIDSIPVLVAELPKLIAGIIEFLIDSIPMIIRAGIELLGALAKATPQIIESVVASIPEIIDGIVDTLTNPDSLGEIIQAGFELLVSLVTDLPMIIIELTKAIPRIVMAIAEKFMSLHDDMAKSGKEFFISLVNRLPEIIKELVEKVKGIIQDIKNTFLGGKKDMEDAGQGLIGSLWGGMLAVKDKLKANVKALFNDVMDSAKESVGMASGSTVAKEVRNIGSDIGSSFAIGLDSSSYMAEMAAQAMADQTISAYRNMNDEMMSISDDEVKYTIGNYEKKAKAAKSAKKKEVDEEAKAAKELAAINAEMYKGYKEQRDAMVFYGQVTTRQLVEFWREAMKSFEEGSKEWMDAEKEMYAARYKLEEENFNNAKKWIDERKKYNEISVQEEIDFWLLMSEQYVEGTKQREIADASLFEAQKRLFTEQEKIMDQMEQAEDKYAKAVDARAEAIANMLPLFDALKEREKVSSKDLMKNLQDQVKAMQDWESDIIKLSNSAIDEGLLAKIKAMPESARPNIKALTTMTDTELTKYSELWRDKNEIARRMAVDELQGLREDTDAKIKELLNDMETLIGTDGIPIGNKLPEAIRDGIYENYDELVTAATDLVDGATEAASELITEGERIGEELPKAVADGIDSEERVLIKKTEDVVKDTVDAADKIAKTSINVGKNFIISMIQGIRDTQSALFAAIKEVCEQAIKTAEGVFKIGSPSKVFRGMGQNIGSSTMLGWEDIADTMYRSMDDLMTGLTGIAEDNLQLDTSGLIAGLRSVANASLTSGVGGLIQNITMQVKMDEVDQVYKMTRIFENLGANRNANMGLAAAGGELF